MERVVIEDLELAVTLLETSAGRCADEEDMERAMRVARWIDREIERRRR